MKIRFLTVLIFLLIAMPLTAAPQPGGGGTTPGGTTTGETKEEKKDEKNKAEYYLELITLEDFEEAEDWKAKATSPLGTTKTLKLVQRGPIVSADNAREEMTNQRNVNEKQFENNPNHIMGVKTHFEDRGFDRVEITPPHEFIIKGKARQFSIWVLGRKYRHTLNIKLRDYRGKLHLLRLGRLDFFGWRKLTVTIPGWLPQSSRYSMLDKNLHFVSLFVTSDVHEVPGTFYFYVDQLNVLVDKSEAEYPGSEVKDNW